MSVDEPLAVALVVANVAVAPAGRLVAENAMVSAVPAVDVVDTAVVVERPWPTVSAAGDAVIEKPGLAITTSDTVVVCVADDAVPVIAIAYVPGAVVASAASVSVDVSPALTLVGADRRARRADRSPARPGCSRARAAGAARRTPVPRTQRHPR